MLTRTCIWCANVGICNTIEDSKGINRIQCVYHLACNTVIHEQGEHLKFKVCANTPWQTLLRITLYTILNGPSVHSMVEPMRMLMLWVTPWYRINSSTFVVDTYWKGVPIMTLATKQCPTTIVILCHVLHVQKTFCLGLLDGMKCFT